MSGEFQNVVLSDIEFHKLEQRFGPAVTADYIERLSAYLKNRPRKKYASHYAVVQTWIRREGPVKQMIVQNLEPVDPDYQECRCQTIFKMFERDFNRGLRANLPSLGEIREKIQAGEP